MSDCAAGAQMSKCNSGSSRKYLLLLVHLVLLLSKYVWASTACLLEVTWSGLGGPADLSWASSSIFSLAEITWSGLRFSLLVAESEAERLHLMVVAEAEEGKQQPTGSQWGTATSDSPYWSKQVTWWIPTSRGGHVFPLWKLSEGKEYFWTIIKPTTPMQTLLSGHNIHGQCDWV